MKTLTKKEKQILNFLNYECRENEFTGWKETRSLNPDFLRLSRNRISKELKKRSLKINGDLFFILKKEHKEFLKARKKRDELYAREEKIKNEKQLCKMQVYRIILRKQDYSFSVIPTKKLIKEFIRFEYFRKMTGFARNFLEKNWRNLIFEALFNFKNGAHGNSFSARIKDTLTIYHTREEDWDIYSKRTKQPAYNYTFHLEIPSSFSIKKTGSIVTFFKGKYNRCGIEASWFEQSRGLSVKKIDGFLVKNYHVRKSTKINSLESAKKYVAEIRANLAKELNMKRFLSHLSHDDKIKMLSEIWITEKDSVKAGNCPAGTAAFKANYERKNKLGTIGAIRADELLAATNGNLYFIKRIFSHKLGISI